MSIVQVIRPEEVRSVAGGPGIQGREGVIYQTLRNGSALAKSYLWDGEKHYEIGASVSGAGKLIPRNRPLNRMLRAPFSDVVASATTVSNGTWQMIIQSPVPFDGVRVLLSHRDANAIAGVKVAAASGGAYATDKVGNGLAWVNGTFDGGAATGTLPAGTSARPSRLMSDDIYVASVPRTDGGTGHMAYVRVYLPNGANPFSFVDTANPTQYNGLADGAVYVCHEAGIDAVANPALLTTTTSRLFSAIHGVEFITRTPSATLLTVGDSITRGQTATVTLNKNFSEYAANAANALNLGCSFGGANFGYSAQNTATFFARMMDLIKAVRPGIAIMPMGSPNDNVGTITEAIVSTQRAYALRFVELCEEYGVVPVLWTQLPAASAKGYNAASELLRLGLNADLAARLADYVLVADFSAALGNNATPLANLLPANSGDGLHLNDAGQAAAGAVLLDSVCRPIAAAV